MKCQMCPPSSTSDSDKPLSRRVTSNDSEKTASVWCEQCEIFYCDECRDTCHPMRGPYSKHNLVEATLGRDMLRRKSRAREAAKCDDHPNECATLYCLLCKTSCCSLCVTESSMHLNHQILHINQYSKSQKVILIPPFI